MQGAKAVTVIQGISHEVHRPFGVGSGRHAHRLLDPLGQAPLGSPGQIELHGLIDTGHAFVVPPLAQQTQAVVAQPTPPAGLLLHHAVQRLPHFPIREDRPAPRPVPTRARKLYGSTGAGLAQSPLGHQVVRGFALRRWPQSFFAINAFRASFSRASSAYIRLY